MVGWIINNKEWLFSGIGIFIAIGLFNLFKKKFKLPNINTDLNSGLISSENKSVSKNDLNSFSQAYLTPKYIREEIEKVPPFQKKDIIKHYIGQNIDWEMEFFSAEERANGYVRVSLSGNNINYLTFFDIKLSKYPGLTIMKKGANIRVKGVIKSIDDLCFNLKDVILIL